MKTTLEERQDEMASLYEDDEVVGLAGGWEDDDDEDEFDEEDDLEELDEEVEELDLGEDDD